MTHDLPTIFIGYDAREHDAAMVAAQSVRDHSSRPLHIFLLEHMELRSLRLFDRQWETMPQGQTYDKGDGKPFSTAFSHSRFLAFYLADQLGCTEPCMFVDCDWLFLDDVQKVFREQEKHRNKIGVVSRERKVEDGSTKMDGMVQSAYHRKLWSAMFTWHPKCKAWSELFSVSEVNKRTGRELHSFMGLAPGNFWEIDPLWHYIPSLDPKPKMTPFGVHFSEFSPWLNPEHGLNYPFSFNRWNASLRDYHRRASKSEYPCKLGDLSAHLSKRQVDNR